MKLFKCFAALCLICICVLPSLAHANRTLILQNETSQAIDVAIRYHTSNIWYTKGWYRVQPGQSYSMNVMTTNQYMYVYGRGNHGEWTGQQDDSNDPWLPVVNQSFSVVNNNTPGGSGRRKVLFNMINFGNSTQYVHTFR